MNEINNPVYNLKSALKKVQAPPLSPMASLLVKQKAGGPKALAKVVAAHPLVARHVLGYAQCPHFLQGEPISDIEQAINRVLGYETAWNVAYGFSLLMPLKVHLEGPLGMKAFWRHAVYSGALCHALSSLQPDNNLPAGTSYLCGLLHNCGILAFGTVFPKPFMALVEAVNDGRLKSQKDTELKLYGIHHGQMGAWLLKQWRLPEEVVVAARHHHSAVYTDSHDLYPKMVKLGNHLLKRDCIGDELTGQIPKGLIDALDVGEYMVLSALEKVMASAASLDAMAELLIKS